VRSDYLRVFVILLATLPTLVSRSAVDNEITHSTKDSMESDRVSHTEQDVPVRSREAVETTGRFVMQRYQNQLLAQYGILDVTKPPYLADSSGRRDSTRSIQQAIKDARDARLITYLPSGSYLISDTLDCTQGTIKRDHWSFGPADPIVQDESYYFPCTLVGARNGARTKVILRPRSSGFGDHSRPKPAIHFWARSHDPRLPAPSISFNQMIMNVDILLGAGNSGAVGIDYQAAQGSTIEDVSIDATGALAGIQKAPGSGGGIHGLTIVGGRYGLFLRGDPKLRGTQPAPVISNVTLKDQTDFAVLYDGRGPLTVVGGLIEGAGVRAEAPRNAPWNGAMNFIDTVFRVRPGIAAITSSHSVFLHNAYFYKARVIVHVDGRPELYGQPQGWTRVEEYAVGATVEYPQSLGLGGLSRQDLVYVNGRASSGDAIANLDNRSSAPPSDLQSRHAWRALPSWDDSHVANVREKPYGAKGDGKADDTAAIQRAIDENDSVFLPTGEYRVSRPLILHSRTQLFGVSNVLSVVSLIESEYYRDVSQPAPLIDTVDDPDGTTTLAFVELRVPITHPTAYALRWRVGRNSVVRNIDPVATFWDPNAPAGFNAMIRIEGSGGGNWYDLAQWHWWAQGPAYRHLLVTGTREPLAFYMLNPEHASSDAQIEFDGARHISVYSLKSEGIFTTLWIHDCRDVAIYGFGGIDSPAPDWPLFRIERSTDFLLANVDPEIVGGSTTLGRWEGYQDALGVASDPRKWVLLRDAPEDSAVSNLYGAAQVVLYQRGAPSASSGSRGILPSVGSHNRDSNSEQEDRRPEFRTHVSAGFQSTMHSH
jgi:hypothetical protein